MKFDDVIKSYLEEKTNLNPNELRPGDEIENCNQNCKHFGSKGVVTKVKRIEGKGGTVGNKIEYKISNKGHTYKPGDKVEKTEIQLKRPLE